MKTLKIDQSSVDPADIGNILELCPFSAIDCNDGKLSINSSCRMCGICVRTGPVDVFTWVEETVHATTDKSLWHGIAVFAEQHDGKLHNVAGELIGKARELAAGQPVYALVIGSGISEAAERLLMYGTDRVYVYDDKELAQFDMERYANVFSDFISKVKPSSIMVGATSIGRSLAPRVAARFRTGLTADCTALEVRDGTELIQIRPAFGGNIMARIVTPERRPQFCTVRYKVFSAPDPVENPTGVIERVPVDTALMHSRIRVLTTENKPSETDLSEAKIIVAVGRGLKSKADLVLAEDLANMIGAQIACTRPLVENGWFTNKRQIGLSGRTVSADLIITLGISGSVQFAAGMKGSQCIIAVNNDKQAGIFDVAHYGLIGDLYEVVPALIASVDKARG